MRSCRDVLAEALQAHATITVRELHLHPLMIREACYTNDVAHAAYQRDLDLAYGCCHPVPPCNPHQVGLTVLQDIVQHAPLCLRVQRQSDQLLYLVAGAVTALLDMLRYKRFISQHRPASDSSASCNGCPELGGDVPGLVGVRAVYQRLS